MNNKYIFSIIAIISIIKYLGIDFTGSKVIFQIEEQNLSLEEKKNINDILNLRLNNLNLGKSKSQLLGEDKIMVNLPNDSDLDNIIKLLQQKGNLSIYLDEFNVYTDNMYNDNNKLKDEELVKLFQKTELTNISLENVDYSFNELSYTPVINLKFNKNDTEKFYKLTRENIGKISHIVLDNKIISSPNIREPIPNGEVQISGNFTVEEAKELSILLKSGSILYNLTVFKKEEKLQ